MLASSVPKGRGKAEKEFLAEVHVLLKSFNAATASAELERWGGWYRNRFREDPSKCRRVLADIAGMLREKRVHTSPGAAFHDLWERLP